VTPWLTKLHKRKLSRRRLSVMVIAAREALVQALSVFFSTVFNASNLKALCIQIESDEAAMSSKAFVIVTVEDCIAAKLKTASHFVMISGIRSACSSWEKASTKAH